MPEYRRFVAYFYEYINGKKQKNAGFAKVELRNGMWRILFRLMADMVPEVPVQVYGFVREEGYLLGFPLGTMEGGREISQEWAYRAETPIGHERYRFEDLSGIWAESGDGRCFITVWDDDPVDLKRFVLELPGEQQEDTAEERMEPESRSEGMVEEQMEPESRSEDSVAESVGQERQGETEVEEEAWPEEQTAAAASAAEAVEVLPEERKMTAASERTDVREEQNISAAEHTAALSGKFSAPMPDTAAQLLKKRQHFRPFADNEIVNCIQIMPCDVAALQQENWQVGRSSFLQHGYYQHRHLLFGTTTEGEYILGVPGIQTQQEQYMAKMFGFDRFKLSRICGGGRRFGYWYRTLKKERTESC